MSYSRMHNYPTGAIIMRSGGTEVVKTKEGWKAVSRVVAATSSKVYNGGRDLDEYDKVFHLDCTTKGEKGHNDPANLVVIRVNREKVKFIKGSRVVFVPQKNKEVFEFASLYK